MTVGDAPGIAAKVAFLRRPDSYRHRPATVEVRETHMSWLFLAGDLVFKLKKPLRLPFLDFSTIERRRRNCVSELRLNRRLARAVYLDVVPLILSPRGTLRLGGSGRRVDWVVQMRRLADDEALDRQIVERRVDREALRRAAMHLVRFFGTAAPTPTTPRRYLARLIRDVTGDLEELGRPELRVSAKLLAGAGEALRRYLDRHGAAVGARGADRLVDGHGDLRPEHVYLAPEPIVIDCLEFNACWRQLDPVEEIAFLAMECELLGDAFVGDFILHLYAQEAGERPPEPLVAFYKAKRALLRAKLTLWHLLDPERDHRKDWQELGLRYLDAAARNAVAIGA